MYPTPCRGRAERGASKTQTAPQPSRRDRSTNITKPTTPWFHSDLLKNVGWKIANRTNAAGRCLIPLGKARMFGGLHRGQALSAAGRVGIDGGPVGGAVLE